MKPNKHQMFLCMTTLFIGQMVMQSTAMPQNLDLAEYDVYSSLIKRIYIEEVPKDSRFDLLVIEQRTSLQDNVLENLDRAFKTWRKEIPNLSEETLDNLKATTQQPQQLMPLFNIPMKYRIVTKEELKNSFAGIDSADAWERFYQTYPNSSGIVSLSRVGFNRARNQALVYIERNCGYRCAGGHIIFLTKERRKWVVRRIFMMWIV